MLRQRVLFGSLMSVLILVAFLFDSWFQRNYPCWAVLVGLVGGATARELGLLLAAFPMPVRVPFCTLGGVLIPLSVWLPPLSPDWLQAVLGSDNPNFRPPAATFLAFCMVAFLIEAWRYRAPGTALMAIAGHVTVFFYAGLLGSFVVLLRWFPLTDSTRISSAFVLVTFVFTAKFCDMGAYFTGKFFGRNKLAPLLSPGKTREGAVGGIVASVLFAFAAYVVGRHPRIDALPEIPWYSVLLFGGLIGLAALVGDLMESLIKRDCRRKDASDSIPGFGGILDVVDSVFFSAPVAYLLLSAWQGISKL